MNRAAHPRVRSFEELQLGEIIESAALTVTETHVVAFANLTGDFHPLHTDDTAAARTPYRRRVAHGLLVTSLCNGLLNQADAFAALAILSIEYTMGAPVFIGDTIRARSTLLEKRPTSKRNRGIVVYRREVLNQNDEVVQHGTTTFLATIDKPVPEKPRDTA